MPAHAQRMSSLLAAEREFAPCRELQGEGMCPGYAARSVQGGERDAVQIRGGRAGQRGGAHLEHPGHACDAGRIEAERLVERARVLCREGSQAG